MKRCTLTQGAHKVAACDEIQPSVTQGWVKRVFQGSNWCHDSGMMGAMEQPYERLMRLIAEARKRQRLDRQIDLARVSGLSKSTIYRLERGQELGDSALRDISKAIGWTADSAERVLAGGDPANAGPVEADLEARYRREPITDGQLTQAFEDALYEALIVAAPDTPLSQIDKARRAAFEVLRRNGIEVARRHRDDQSGNGDGA